MVGTAALVRTMVAGAARPGLVAPLALLSTQSNRPSVRLGRGGRPRGAPLRGGPRLAAGAARGVAPARRLRPSAWEDAVAELGANRAALVVADTVAAIASSALHLPLSGEGPLADLSLSAYRLACRAPASVTSPYQAWSWVQQHAEDLADAPLPLLEAHRPRHAVAAFRGLLCRSGSVAVSETASLPVVTRGADLVHPDLASADKLTILVPRAEGTCLGSVPSIGLFGPLEVFPDILGPRRLAGRAGAVVYGVQQDADLPPVEGAAWVTCRPTLEPSVRPDGRWSGTLTDHLANTVRNTLRPTRRADLLPADDEQEGPYEAPAGAVAELVPPVAHPNVVALLRVSTRQQVKKSNTLTVQAAVVGAGMQFINASGIDVRLFVDEPHAGPHHGRLDC